MPRNAYKGSKSGVKGIYFENRGRKKWRATYTVGKKKFNVGYFFDIESASHARDEFEKKLKK